MNKEAIIELENITVRYDHKTVLQDVSLSISSLDFLGILGPNGGGKTTLIKTIMGLKEHAQGHIRFFRNGMPCDHLHIGYLPQYNQVDKRFPITVREVISSGLEDKSRIWKKQSREEKDKIQHTIQRMGLEGLEDRPIGSLSGGQIQRTLLGRAVISQPEVLVLDEPNTYIDKHFETQLYELLHDINQESTILLVSHDIRSVLQHATSIAYVHGNVHFYPDKETFRNWIQKEWGLEGIGTKS